MYGIFVLPIATEKNYCQWQYNIVWIVDAMFTNKGLLPHKEIPIFGRTKSLPLIQSIRQNVIPVVLMCLDDPVIVFSALFLVNIFTDQNTNAYLLLW